MIRPDTAARGRQLMRGLALCALACLPLSALATWQLKTFDVPGMTNTLLGDVNASGQIVGYAYSDSLSYSFIYAGGTLQKLPELAGHTLNALGIADSGLVVGSATSDATGNWIGFLFEGGSYSYYGVPGALNTNIRHVSADGRYLTGDYSTNGVDSNGFAYDRQTGQLQRFPAGSGYQIIQGANNLGQITGSYLELLPNHSTVSGGLLYDMGSGTTTRLPTLDGIDRPRFRDINESGTLVGFTTAGGGAFVGTLAGGLERFSMPGAEITFAYGLNDKGTIVGFYQLPGSGDEHGFIATSVPEPGQAALMLGGLLALGGWRRLKSRSNRAPVKD